MGIKQLDQLGEVGERSCQWHRRTPASETMLKARRKAAGRRITAGEDKAYEQDLLQSLFPCRAAPRSARPKLSKAGLSAVTASCQQYSSCPPSRKLATTRCGRCPMH
jgi:hypothetical protein